MAIDTILVCGAHEPKIPKLLEKLGYSVLLPGNQETLPSVLGSQIVDLILIDGRAEVLLPDLIEYLHADELVRKIPVIAISGGALPPESALKRVELLPSTISPGLLAGKIATALRLRKMQGMQGGDHNASLAEMNAALRDLSAHFKKELEEARKIQLGLLPKELPQGSSHQISMTYQPLEDVGGDWCYAEYTPSGKILLQIADVTGHGLAAAFLGSMTRLALFASKKEAPSELFAEMNRLLSEQLPPERFVTAACVLFDPATGKVSYASAGHPPLIRRAMRGAKVEEVKTEGFAFGFFPDSVYKEVSFELAPREAILLFTDGLSEAQNRSLQAFGIERVRTAFQGTESDLSADQLRDGVLAQFESFRDGRLLKDDITLIVLKRTQ